mgnify:CR=1 FL=1
MTQLSSDDALAIVKTAISTVAPDVEDELDAVDPGVDLWEDLELDSMDHLNVMVELKQQTGVDVPEREYGRLRSLQAIAGYLVATSA